MNETKSCLNCVHAKVWNYESSLDDDVTTGFECRHPNPNKEGWVEPESYVTMTTEEFALYCARSCNDYKELKRVRKNNISKPLVYKKRKLDYDKLEQMKLNVVMARRGDKVLEFYFCHARKIFSYKVYNTAVTSLYYEGTDLNDAVRTMNE